MTMASTSPLLKSIVIIILGQAVCVSCIRGKKQCSLSGKPGEVNDRCNHIAAQVNSYINVPLLNERQEQEMFEHICQTLQSILSGVTRALFDVEFTDLVAAILQGGSAMSDQIEAIIGNINGWFHERLVDKVTSISEDHEQEQAKDQNFSQLGSFLSSVVSKVQDLKTIDGIEAMAAFFTDTGLFFESGKLMCLKMISFLVNQFLSRIPFVSSSSFIERSTTSTGGKMKGERADIEEVSGSLNASIVGLMSSSFTKQLQSVFEEVLKGSAASLFFYYYAETIMSAINAVIHSLIPSKWKLLLKTFFNEDAPDEQRENAWNGFFLLNVVPQVTRYACDIVPLDALANASRFNFSWMLGDDPEETTRGEAEEYEKVKPFVTEVIMRFVKIITSPIQAFMTRSSGESDATSE
eukprot:TRINITY_DN14201_c0_g2_i1.p1 TRINITY_DN14201_c0_g2~~TRINITY_DN14201_c0_g2_i1.p1  ORF type:complete len:409 (+),score=43.18 TRINITY_DN14201_c0_g2_i1:52-1278(+)